MRILITGAGGFIGQHLTTELRTAGHTVHGVDLEHGDLRHDGVAEKLVRRYEPEVVVHLAAQVGRLFSEDDHANAVDANTTMTLRVAQACARHGARLVHTSTSEVYGDHGNTIVPEDAPLTGKPTGIYALSKRWSEDAAREYAPDGLIILRPSMPYGPGAPPGRGRRALDNFLWQAHHRMPITVHEGASRSWCWIGDTTHGIRMIIESGEQGAFNVGRDDVEVPMFDLAVMACRIAGASPALIDMVAPPARQTVVKRLATGRLRALGWEPSVELDEGLHLVYGWVQQFDKDGYMAAQVAA